jgi:hypothetical protein
MRLRLLFASAIIAFLFSNNSNAQIAIPSATPVTQNFDGIGSTATASLPANWKFSPAGDSAPTYVNASNTTATTQAASAPSPVTAGRYNWGNGTTPTDRAIGIMTSGAWATPNSIMASYQNTSSVQINDLAISFDYERYRINSAAAQVTFFTSTDGTTWTARTAGDSGAFSTATSSYTFTGGTVVTKTFTLTAINIASGANLYLRWNFNTTGTNSQGLGLDNVSLTATLAPAGITTAQNGPWDVGSTWTGGIVPTNSQNAVINHNVTSALAIVRDAGTTTTVNTGASLAIGSATYTNNGSTTINGTFQINDGGWATGTNFTYGAAGTLNFNGAAGFIVNGIDVFWPAASGPYNVNVLQTGITLNASRTVNGLFSTAAAGVYGVAITSPAVLTLNGTCRIDLGGFFADSPVYGPASTLVYNAGGNYGRSKEWYFNGVGTINSSPGYPNNVQVTNNTTLDYNNGTPQDKAMFGNLTIDSGSTLTMNLGTSSALPMTVGGNVSNAGTLTLGTVLAADLKLYGNFTNTGTFNGNSRALWFSRTSGTQTVTSTTLTIPYIVFDSTGSRTVQLVGTTFNITAPIAGNVIVFGSASDVLDLNGADVTVGTAGVVNILSGPAGTFKGSTSSKLRLDGTGSIGTLNFTTGFQNLGTFTINRTAGAIGCVLGTPLTVNASLALTNGIVDLGNNTMTVQAAATITGASSSNYIIADAGYGTSAALKKGFSAAPSNYVFPVGDRAASADGTQYSPVTINGSAGTYSSAYITVSVNDIKHPSFDATSEYITRYWDISTTGISGSSLTANGSYLDADVFAPAFENNYAGNKWNGTVWSNGGSTGGAATNSTLNVGITLLGTNHVTAGRRDADINIQVSSVNYLTGSTYAFGSVLVGNTNAVTFTIQNIGQASFTLSNASPAPVAPFVYTTPYTNGSVTGPSGTQSFTVTFTPTAAGAFTGSITVKSNDPDEANYVINFTGTGVIPVADIEVRGNNILIPPGNTPTGLDFTLFGSQNIGTTSAAKTHEIKNTGTGTLTLTGSFVTLGGANASEFAIASMPLTSIAAGASSTFTLTFTPTAAGTRNATVTVYSNDPDEATYTYNIQGTGSCATATNVITPLSGPVGTEVTITASANTLTGATATFNGISATVTQVSSTVIKVIVPGGAISGNLITTNTQGCTATNTFTVIDNLASTCQGGNTASDLFISEVTDATTGGVSYVEIYNATSNPINVNGYSLKTYSNGDTLTPITIALNSFVLAPQGVYLVALGVTASPNSTNTCTGVTGGNGSLANQTTTAAGINFDIAGNDYIGLYKNASASIIDSYGTFGSATWADGLGLGDRGATFRRKNTATVPNSTFSTADWNITDWAGSGQSSCGTNDYSDIGTFNFLSGTPPTVTQNPSFTPSCKSTSLTVAGTEGFAGGNPLVYQWYSLAPGATTWTALTNAGVYSGATSATLNISSIAGLDGYQFYSQIRENTATCYAASNAVKISEALTVTWNGTAWSPSAPTINNIAVINGNYNTAANGSFEACSVSVSGGSTLIISASNYVSIQNDLNVSASGTLQVLNQGSLVMIDNNGAVTNSGTTNVIRTTSPYNKYDYTYWSSPVTAATIGTTFPLWRTDYAFQFVTGNYADVAAPINGFDDDGNAWSYTGTSTVMTPGKGYAIMAPSTGTFPATSTVTFSGAVNNGIINIPMTLSANGASSIDDFNLIGNPYPSAIYANDFINANAAISGTLYFWTHRTGISNTNPGPDANNFITADYAMYNLSGGTSSGTGSAPPTGYIGSGQAFFVETNSATNAVFNNSMRDKSYSNAQFYRMANPMTTPADSTVKDRLWINLQSADGLFSQQLLAYFDNTTLGYDRAYDGVVSQSSNTLSFYSFIEGDKYRIQARPAFSQDDVVPLGYSSTMQGTFSVAIDHLEGQLQSDGTSVYLEDKLLSIIHDLKQSPYTFTTAIGTFDDRFVLRYTNSGLGTIDLDEIRNNVVVASSNAQIMVKSYTEPISGIAIYDILGRQVFAKDKISANEFTITDAVKSQQALIVKVTLENGVVVSRKIVY